DRGDARGERECLLAGLDRRDVALERGARRILGPRVLVALVAAELILDVGRGLEDRRDDRSGGWVGLLAGVNTDGREACAIGQFHSVNPRRRLGGLERAREPGAVR